MKDINVGHIVRLHAAVLGVLLATTVPAFAGTVTVPEIDGASLSSGLGLVAAGVLWLRSRRRSK